MPSARGVLRRIRHPIRWGQARRWGGVGNRILHELARETREPFAVEIGAHDGVEQDLLREWILDRGWRALMVEPQSDVFDRLRRNLARAGERVAFENAAIAETDGPVRFHHVEWVDRERGVRRLESIGTLSAEAARISSEYFVPEPARRIVTEVVPGLTFQTLCRRHAIERVDALVIDAEGSDLDIVREVLAGSVRPRLLVYEHIYYSAAERQAGRDLVEAAGYSARVEGRDTWCLDIRPRDRLTRVWARVQPRRGGDVLHPSELTPPVVRPHPDDV